jgi:6-phosphogluconolactonase (cycloisomerase 2 family)
MNSNTVTGLPAPTNASDAATRQFVLDNAAPVTSVNTKTDAVVLTATDIAITDDAGNFTTDTVQGAIDQLFLSANNGKTSIATAIGSPALATETFAQLAAHVTTGKGQIATATGNATVSSSSTFTQLADAIAGISNITYGVEKTVIYDETIAKGDVVESYYKSVNLTRLSQMPTGTQPDTDVDAVAWSNDGTLFATGHTLAGNRLSIFNYDQTTEEFTNFTNPSTMPTSTVNEIAFSPNDNFLAVAHAANPALTVYKKNGNSYVKLLDSSVLGAGNSNPGGSTARGCAWSPNGEYLSVVMSSGSFLSVYHRSGEIFSRLANATDWITAQASSTVWSADSKYVFCSYVAAPYFKIYRVDGSGSTSSLIRVANNESLDNTPAHSAWSPDGNYLACVYNGTNTAFGSNKLAVYKQNGDVFTRLTVDSSITELSNTSLAWSKCGRYIFAVGSAGKIMSIYKRTGDMIVRQSNLPTASEIYGTLANHVAVHPNNNIISVGHNGAPFATHYRNDGVYLFTKANTDVINPIDKIIGIAKQTGIAGQQRTIDVLVGRSLLP